MMVEKECGIIENAIFPSIWELSPQPGSPDKSVVDAVEKTEHEDPDKYDAGTVIG
jgi:hypothetical protein